MRSYHEHLTNSFNRFLTHLHHSTLDALAFWNLQCTARAIQEIHHRDEFWFFNLFKWLVASDNPLREMLLEFFLIPRSLSHVIRHKLIKVKGAIITYASPGPLIFKCFLDVFRCVFKLLDVFRLCVSIKFFLAGSNRNFIRCRGLIPVFEDGIQLKHGLDVDTEVVNKN